MIRAIDESSRSAGQLLDHAMVNFRADQFEVNTVNLPELVRDVCERLSPLAGLKDIVINIQSQESDMSFQGDTILLQNALRNILDNAIKYSPDDSEISVKCFRNEKFVISIQDSGRGFSGIDHTDRFTRGTNVSDVIGSGLGLTIANEVAIAHGGSLLINDSKKGVGSCVSLVLPI
jgi:two-component system sensor histidine kinase TctE